MDIHITARHMELTPGLKTHVEDRVRRLERLYDRLVDVHVILTAEKHGHVAEISTKMNGHALVSREETQDVFASVDCAVEKVERQLKTLRGKLTQRKGQIPTRERANAASWEVRARVASAAQGPIEVVSDETLAVELGTVDGAVEELARGVADFVVFEDEETRRLSVVYRRRDGNLGVIETL